MCVPRVSSPRPATCGHSGSLCGRCWAFVRSNHTPTSQMNRSSTTLGSSSETKADRYITLGPTHTCATAKVVQRYQMHLLFYIFKFSAEKFWVIFWIKVQLRPTFTKSEEVHDIRVKLWWLFCRCNTYSAVEVIYLYIFLLVVFTTQCSVLVTFSQLLKKCYNVWKSRITRLISIHVSPSRSYRCIWAGQLCVLRVSTSSCWAAGTETASSVHLLPTSTLSSQRTPWTWCKERIWETSEEQQR